MPTSMRSGDVLAGRYRLIDLLSESGGGRFWRARDAVLERYVALHVIDQADDRAARLVAAARTSAGVLDSRILRVLDAEHEDGRCFVVNEWGTGVSLDILVTHAGPLTPRRAAWLVADVADALARAHAAGVTHGRLNPENVLIDRYGSIRLIGMCVDAALHGLEPGEVRGDLEDLGGLLYCALTATWPGPSGSIVPAAPRENGTFLSPRQVVAGVPKPLDLLWRELDRPGDPRRTGRRLLGGGEQVDVSSAAAIARLLQEFVGDPTGMPESLAQAIPPVNELGLVWLPSVADPLPFDASRDDLPVVRADDDTGEMPEIDDDPRDGGGPGVPATAGAEDELGLADVDDGPPIPLVSELPTEAGMPVFGDDDVAWLRTRTTPPPPPPPFEEPPERPLFAPDPPGGVRRPRIAPVPGPPAPAGLLGPPGAFGPPGPPGANGAATGYWPWDTDAGVPGKPDEDDDQVPGRTWLRLAMAVGLAVLLLVAVAIAFNLGRGRTPLGGDPDESPIPTEATTTGQAAVLRGITVTDLDPLGDGEERPDEVGNLVDGDAASTWSTQTYNDQLGPPPGLKTGVGVVLDLGAVRSVASVEVRMAGDDGDASTTVGLYASVGVPTEAPTGEALATGSGGGRLTLVPPTRSDGTTRVEARYLVLWWTSLPEVDDGFRAEVAEVLVRGE